MATKLLPTALLATALLVVATSTAFATGQAEGEGAATEAEQATIVWAPHWTNVADTTLRDLADEYEAQNPSVTIEIEAIGNYNQVIRTRLAANEVPDVFRAQGGFESPEDRAQFLVPLGDMFSPDEMYLYDANPGPDGEPYAFATVVNYAGLIYNKNVFEELGIDGPPRTRTEFFEMAEDIAAADVVPMATAFQSGWPVAGMYWQHYPNALAGEVYHDTWGLESEDYFTGDPLVTSLSFLRDIVTRGFAEPEVTSASWEANHQRIAQGNAAMMMLATYYPAQLIDAGLERDSIGMVPFPNADHVVVFGGGHYGVSNSSEHLDEALSFFEFLYRDGRLGLALGNIPSYRDVELPDFPWVDEILSYGLDMVEFPGHTADYLAVRSELGRGPASYVQEYVLSDNPQELLEEWNRQWLEAREEVQSD